MTLAELPLGQPGRIISIAGATSARRRLLELGLLPQTEVRVVHVAPLGDPLSLRVRNGTLSIRRAEAHHISVVRVEPT
ncbi:MAG TPA: FeoA domain-containing protein [Polyangiaceae bacterium]|nr:FeoA domain-containing protein [Polyangiaceae bacterium]